MTPSWRTWWKSNRKCHFRAKVLKVWLQQQQFLRTYLLGGQNQDSRPTQTVWQMGGPVTCFNNLSRPLLLMLLWCRLKFETHWFGTGWVSRDAEKVGEPGAWENVRGKDVDFSVKELKFSSDAFTCFQLLVVLYWMASWSQSHYSGFKFFLQPTYSPKQCQVCKP